MCGKTEHMRDQACVWRWIFLLFCQSEPWNPTPTVSPLSSALSAPTGSVIKALMWRVCEGSLKKHCHLFEFNFSEMKIPKCWTVCRANTRVRGEDDLISESFLCFFITLSSNLGTLVGIREDWPWKSITNSINVLVPAGGFLPLSVQKATAWPFSIFNAISHNQRHVTPNASSSDSFKLAESCNRIQLCVCLCVCVFMLLY